jgi:hypothetical protein
MKPIPTIPMRIIVVISDWISAVRAIISAGMLPEMRVTQLKIAMSVLSIIPKT